MNKQQTKPIGQILNVINDSKPFSKPMTVGAVNSEHEVAVVFVSFEKFIYFNTQMLKL